MQNKIYIPIGIDCSAAHYLRKKQLRKHAFPFDWNVTPIQSALELIQNNFKDFLVEENLLFLKPTPRLLFEENGSDLKITDELITPVICKKYNMLFPHDFSKDGLMDLPKVQEKYEKRIKRIQNLLKSKQYKCFIFCNNKINSWQKEQYEIAKIEISFLKNQKIKQDFKKLNLLNSGMTSLSRFKVSQTLK